MSADREKVEVRRRDVDITSELFCLQRQKGRRAMAWDVTFELVRASVGAPDSDRYRLVTQKVIEEIVRHLGEVYGDGRGDPPFHGRTGRPDGGPITQRSSRLSSLSSGGLYRQRSCRRGD